MIKISRGQLMDGEFRTNIKWVFENAQFSHDPDWLFDRICKLIDSTNRETLEKTREYILKNTVKDESGQPKVKEDQDFEWVSEEAKTGFDAIAGEEVTFFVRKMPKNALSETKMPTKYWLVLKPFIEE